MSEGKPATIGEVASIGLGGIEIKVLIRAAEGTTLLQSDWVELKWGSWPCART